MMNILQLSAGTATVLGVDSRRLGPAQFRQIGYVSENQDMPGWMTISQLLDYCVPFYPTWDAAFAEDFCGADSISRSGGSSRTSRAACG